MLVFHSKKHGINFYNVWFAEAPLKAAGIITHYEYKGSCPKQAHIEFDTLITDLTEEEEQIKQHFSKSCKYKVNRAAREDVVIEIKESVDLDIQDIEQFCVFFSKFWESKGSSLSDIEKLKSELIAYRDAGALTIAYAKVEGEVAIYHTHVADDSVARLLHSASLYRLQQDIEGNTKNLIGMANRLLHFEEMKFFKKCGKKVYDWGGAGRAEDVAKITEFKESFGGTPITYYNFEQVNGILARAFKLLVKILGR